MTDTESKFKSALHLETTPMFGWLYPDTWIFYDTEVSEKSLEEADYECMQDTDHEQATIQLEMSNEHGKTSLPVKSVTDALGNLTSRNL